MRMMKKFNLVLALMCAVVLVSSCKKTEPIVAVNNTNADGKAKYLRLLEKKFGSHKYVKQYKKYLEFPQAVKTIQYEVERVYELKYEGEFENRYPKKGPHGFLNYSELGYFGQNGDMWFSGIQGSGENCGSFSVKNGNVTFYRDIFEGDPDSSYTLTIDNESYTMNVEYPILYIEKDGKRRTVFDYKKDMKEPYDGSLDILSTSIKNRLLFGSYLITGDSIERYVDKFVVCFDVKKRNSVSMLILPFSSKLRGLNGVYTTHRNVDSRLNIYYQLMDIEVINDKVLMVFSYPTRDYYLLRLGNMHEISTVEKEMGYNFLIGEDDNLYYQIATDKAYHIFRITPQWDKVIKTQDYVSAIGEFYPKYKEEWDALSD